MNSGRNQGWPVVENDQLDLPLRLPPARKVIRRLADQCPRCHCLHLTTEAIQACHGMTASREQF